MSITDHNAYRPFIIATKALVFASLPFIAVGYATKIIEVAKKISISSEFMLFLLGATLFLPIWLLCKRYLRKPWQFVCTLEHEVTHAVIGLPFLFFPVRMWVTATNGGHVKQRWIGPLWLSPLYGPGRLLSGLAPYFLPTISYVLIILSFLVIERKVLWFPVALGFVTSFHLISTWAETAYRQPDIREAGFIFSTIFLPVANLIGLGGVLAFIADGPHGFTQFWLDGFSASLTSVWNFPLWASDGLRASRLW
jgi:hypothetical protein